MCFLSCHIISFISSSICPTGPQILAYLLSISLKKKNFLTGTITDAQENMHLKSAREVYEKCDNRQTAVQEDTASRIWGKGCES